MSRGDTAAAPFLAIAAAAAAVVGFLVWWLLWPHPESYDEPSTHPESSYVWPRVTRVCDNGRVVIAPEDMDCRDG